MRTGLVAVPSPALFFISGIAGVVEISQPVLLYVMYVLTGVALGRGPCFAHDLWVKIRNSITSE